MHRGYRLSGTVYAILECLLLEYRSLLSTEKRLGLGACIRHTWIEMILRTTLVEPHRRSRSPRL